jgi:hypothetical protein
MKVVNREPEIKLAAAAFCGCNMGRSHGIGRGLRKGPESDRLYHPSLCDY